MNSGSRTGLPHSLAVSLAAALTTWLAMLSWRGFGEDASSYLAPLFDSALIIAGLGGVLRWWRAPGWLVLLAQVIGVGAYVTHVLTGSLLPDAAERADLLVRWEAAVQASQAYASPVPAEAGTLEPLLLPLGVVCLLLVDVVACAWRRVPLAGLVLLTLYAVGVSVLAGQVAWGWFALPAAGFLVMLYLHEDEYVGRWGRGVGSRHDEGGFAVRTGAARTTALGVGAAATALAVVLPALIPTLEFGVFGGGLGAGGDGSVDIQDPVVDLRRDLNRDVDVPLLRLETNDPAPAYLRISVLTDFNGEAWKAGDRDIPADQRADGTLPPLFGVSSSVDRTEYSYRVSALQSFRSTWLPAMATATSVDAPGNWRYDRDTMDFLAADEGTNTHGISYTMQAVDLDLTPEELAAAPLPSGDLIDRYTSLPASVPRDVVAQAQQLTADATSDYQRAVILQNWFRRDGGFEYSLTNATQGNGGDELEAFLTDRVGYCEQFASAMAVMARSLGIPSRVAIGFLTPDRTAADAFEFSAHDLHAWPELYFAGSGWVRFEPTPSTRTPAAPSYTRGQVPQSDEESSSANPDQQSGEPSASASSRPLRPDLLDQQAGGGTAPDTGPRWMLIGSIAGGVVLLVVLALLPGWWRRWRRDARWAADPGPEAAWLELRDTAVDHGRAWPVGLSPQATALRVADWFGDPDDPHPPARPPHGPDYAPDAVAALGRLVQAVERHRYARPGGADPTGADQLREETTTVSRAIAAGTTRRTRRRARWLPRSLFRRTPSAPVVSDDVEVVERGGLVDHVH